MLVRTALTSAAIAALVSAASLTNAAHAQFFRGNENEIDTAPPAAPAAQEQRTEVTESETVDPALLRQVVAYPTREAPGTVIIDTPNTFLYYVLGNGRAIRYGIGVGREGFTWSGVKTISRKAEWPDWHPPAEMIGRQPYLPRMTAGGPGNPLGARALYLGSSAYRIHGTNDPSTIGRRVSSGCIRLTNENVRDLYERVKIGAKVIVLPQPAEARATVRREQAAGPSTSYAATAVSPQRQSWDRIAAGRLY